MKITKSAGALLKPHLSILIPALLEATSELEGTEIGYLSSRLANDPGVQEKLDLARISAAKSSPMMECVNFVIQYIDAATLMGLIPRYVINNVRDDFRECLTNFYLRFYGISL